jgi:hypothetical protein
MYRLNAQGKNSDVPNVVPTAYLACILPQQIEAEENANSSVSTGRLAQLIHLTIVEAATKTALGMTTAV